MDFETSTLPRQTHDLLNDAQRQAVEHVEGPLLILAGPGSGKTRVITHRIAHMMHCGVPAAQILALTFTNKAADEMRARLRKLAPRRGVWMGTFHGFCARLLRHYASLAGLTENFSIFDVDDAKRALKQTTEESGVDTSHVSQNDIAKAISWAKNNLVGPDEFAPRGGHAVGTATAKIYPRYQQLLLESNGVDFDDLLMHVAVMLRDNPELRRSLDEQFRYILVDEYQDTNFAQYAIVRALSQDYPNLAVTGDPDQSIYGWRGANLNNILDFERDFPNVTVVRLEQNYRSTPNILRVADQLIRHNVKRKEKRLFTELAEADPVGLTVYETSKDEADSIADAIAREIETGRRRPRDFAIFYRINALSRLFEHALRSRGIPYQIVNGLEFYQRKEIKDVLAYLHLLNNPRNDVAFLRIVNTPARGIGKKTIERLRAHAVQYRLSMLDAARESGLIESITKRTATQVAKFVAIYDRMAAESTGDLCDVIECVLQESGYREVLMNSENEEDQDRLANLEELLNAAAEWDAQHPEGNALETFLEQAALAADTDAWEAENDQTTLMTMHAAKGLEFPVVYIVAVEENLLPHSRSQDDPDKLEEERRLLFVGITRAMQRLQLSIAQYRAFRGERSPTVPSQFLMELPRNEMAYHEVSSFDFDELDEYGGFGGDGPGGDDDDISFDVASFEADRSQSPVWEEHEINQDLPDALSSVCSEAGISTATDMFTDDGQRPRHPPNAFRRGMRISHPEYGHGTIVSVSGSGPKRMATINFFDSGEQKKFRVAFCPLSILAE